MHIVLLLWLLLLLLLRNYRLGRLLLLRLLTVVVVCLEVLVGEVQLELLVGSTLQIQVFLYIEVALTLGTTINNLWDRLLS